MNLSSLYQRRFAGEAEYRNRLWQLLCRSFFQKYVDRQATVLEVGAGHCEFINHIEAGRKIAVDLSPDVRRHAAKDVEAIVSSSTDLSAVADRSVNVAFISNVLEHLSRPDILATLAELKRVLAPGGRVLILQPNIRYCARDYWMFFDHITPLDDRSVVEALEMSGFTPTKVVPRFLPYTTKSAIPKGLLLVRVYLAVPLLWRMFGAQAFIIAEPRHV
jgi:ubiquinone/menaquinone biosynthesis C-methylase UbiE